MLTAPRARRALMLLPVALALACAGAPIVVTTTPVPTAPAPSVTPAAITRAPEPTRPPADRPTEPPAVTATRQASPTAPPLPSAAPTQAPVRSHPVDPGPYAAGMLASELGAVARLDDATVYTLTVTLEWDAKTIGGHEQVLYTNNEKVALDALYLRLYPNADYYEEGETRVSAVSAGGAALAYQVDGTILRVVPAEPLAPEAQVALDIDFAVAVPHRPDRFGWDGEVMSLGHWYPMMAVYDDEGWNLDPYIAAGDAFYSEISFYTVRLRTAREMPLATTGVFVDERAVPGEGYEYRFVAPAARDFAIAASPDYRVAVRTVNGTTVRSFFLPNDDVPGARAADWGAAAVEAYNRDFGTDPYAELDIAETYFVVEGSPGGMEFPNLVFLSTELYRDEFYASYHEIVLAHEVAHQWFYGVVGNNQVDEPWLDEAFATYASILYAQEVDGEQAGREALLSQALMPYLLGSSFGTAEYPIASSLEDFHGDMLTYSAYVYGKGATFLHLLRRQIGDETFGRLMRYHYEQHRYGVLAPDAFRRSIEAVSGDPAALALYDRWVLTDEPVADEAAQLVDELGLDLP